MKATKLRHKWDFLLNQRLQDPNTNDSEKQDFSEIEYTLTQELIDYMHTTIPYTLKRLLPADLKTMYTGSNENNISIDPNPFQSDFAVIPNLIKGGVYVTNIITYNCVRETEWSDKLSLEMLETEWQCQNCNMQAILTSIQKLQHQQSCNKQQTNEVEKRSNNVKRKSNAQAYDCPDCAQILYLTPIEILKHRKSHIK